VGQGVICRETLPRREYYALTCPNPIEMGVFLYIETIWVGVWVCVCVLRGW
jgi:hypothetical protein